MKHGHHMFFSDEEWEELGRISEFFGVRAHKEAVRILIADHNRRNSSD